MSVVRPSASRRVFAWLVDRNPTYLISACLVAVGARGLLVDPTNPAGDFRLIVVTLAALQCYEWAVGAILLALHRARRAPEDVPSLLLVGALFWTGPIAATLEMIALRPDLGTAVAAGACIIAIGELLAVCRVLGLQLRRVTCLIASACVVLLAIAAPLLKMPVTASGIIEIVLYAAWWVFCSLIFACRGVARAYCNLKLAFPTVAVQSPSAGELGFLGITLGATALHLYAMNYGFFCHARLFYAAPAIVAASVVGVSLLHPFMKRFTTWITICAALPLVAVLLALDEFDASVPVVLLPRPLRSPLIPMLILASAAWYHGFLRHRFISLFHAANAALALAAFRFVEGSASLALLPPRVGYTICLGAVAVYFLVLAVVRRSRADALAGLFAAFATLVQAVWNQTPADGFIVLVACGWTALVSLHIAVARPGMLWRVIPIAFLAFVPWLSNDAMIERVLVGIHSAVLVGMLLIVGSFATWTRYRSIAFGLSLIYVTAASTSWIVATPSPTATILVLAGFVLLVAGAAVSWNKDKLMASLPDTALTPPVEPMDVVHPPSIRE